MAHYIDKDALVAEIEKLKADALQKRSRCKRRGLERIMHQMGAYNKIISLINTLEVKEVDFEKELDRIWFDNKFGNRFDNSAVDFANIKTLCRHFFELGLKVQK